MLQLIVKCLLNVEADTLWLEDNRPFPYHMSEAGNAESAAANYTSNEVSE